MMHKIGTRISTHRKNRNMSQEDLAASLNVSRQTISKWEKGDTLPDVYNIVALAKMFQLSLDELILGAQSKFGGGSYMVQLKNKRRTVNLRAIIVGAIGTTIFSLTMILLDSYNVVQPTEGVIFALVLAFLMFCWGFAIWGFINVSRIADEIKYLERIELTQLHNHHELSE